MSFINKNLLGSTFVQDSNPNYIKIDNVVLGNSAKYGYSTVNTNDIGTLLQNSMQDGNIVVIIFNWAQNIAYIKNGFDLTDSTDCAVNTGFTSFVLISKISAANISYLCPGVATQAPVVQGAAPSAISANAQALNINGFVQTSNGNYTLNGRTFVPVGMNAFFLGLLQETNYYPTHAQITEIFEAARKLGATTIRSHTLGFSAESTMTLIDQNNNINPSAWDSIDFAYSEARRCSIKLIIVLCDPYQYYHGSINTFCAPYGVPKEQFFTHPTPRINFKNYIKQYLSHVNSYTNIAIKDSITVAFLELGNELGNIRPDAGSTALPTQDWIQDISTYIKSITPILILNGSDECLGGSTSNDFSVNTVDTYSSHFYWNDYSRMNNDANNASNAGKGFIIGEYSSQFDINWFKTIESIGNVKGSFAWSIYPHDNGAHDGNRVNHGDGFTFWYDYNTDANNVVLLNLANHFRRMQKLPEISMQTLGSF